MHRLNIVQPRKKVGEDQKRSMAVGREHHDGCVYEVSLV